MQRGGPRGRGRARGSSGRGRGTPNHRGRGAATPRGGGRGTPRGRGRGGRGGYYAPTTPKHQQQTPNKPQRGPNPNARIRKLCPSAAAGKECVHGVKVAVLFGFWLMTCTV